MWLKDSSCDGIIQTSWKKIEGSALVGNFNRNIALCQEGLKVWNCNTFGHVRNTLQRSLKELKHAEESDRYRTTLGLIQELRSRIENLKRGKNACGKQRSRTNWLKEGGQNTKYFHCRANQCNKRNFIAGLEDDTGAWFEEEGQMAKLIEEYFSALFTSTDPSGFNDILCGIQPSVIDDMNEDLTLEFTVEEVHQALKQMAPTIAPGPDGMSPMFYKSFWHIVGYDVTFVVLNALNTGVVPLHLFP